MTIGAAMNEAEGVAIERQGPVAVRDVEEGDRLHVGIEEHAHLPR